MKLIERPEGIPLKYWNDTQMKLWIELIDRGFVNRSSMKVFLDFSKYIDQFYKSHNSFPTIDEILIDLGYKNNA